MKRLIAIGDIHGQRGLLSDLLDQIQPTSDDQLVFLGDYIDRGPDSRGVIEDLIDFKLIYPQTVFLRGNHDQMFLDALISCGGIEGQKLQQTSRRWTREMMRDTDAACYKRNGGDATLKRYGVEMVRENTAEHVLCPNYVMRGKIPCAHIEFFKATQLYYKHGNFTFVHAGYFTLPHGRDAGDTIEEQAINDPYILLWQRYSDPGQNGETLVVGHTPVQDEPFFEEGRISVDTGAAYGGALSAVDVLTGHVLQAYPPKQPNRKPRILGGIVYDD